MFKTVQSKIAFLCVIFSLFPFIVSYLVLGFPKITTAALLAVIITLAVSLVAGVIVGHRFAKPLVEGTSLLWKVSRGDLNYPHTIEAVDDERGQVMVAYREMSKYLKNIKEYLLTLSRGEFSKEFQCESKTDELGQACVELSYPNGPHYLIRHHPL